ncbi:MAG TPA: putative molybdenum carrier protein [Gammaproteobacteria bacterium]
MSSALLQRIVSGGQTGVDRAALDAAIRHGIAHGGWCPRGRLAEGGTVPDRYALRETNSWDYAERTEKNVLDSNGTLILNSGPLEGGTLLTREFAEEHGRPWLLVDLEAGLDAPAVRDWLRARNIGVLNVAGPRESKRPGIYVLASRALDELVSTQAR